MNWDDYFPYFKPNEFTCKCGCGLNNMDADFMDRLLVARKDANIHFIIRSGCRCEEHNIDEGGEETSDHLVGKGADIIVLSGRERYIVLFSLHRVGFTRFGIYSDFIHVGSREDNPQEVLWPGGY